MNKFIEIIKNIKINIDFFNKVNKIKLSKNNNFNNFKIIFSKKFIVAKEKKDIITLSNKIKHFLIIMNEECKNFNPNLLIKNFSETKFDISNIKDKDDFFGTVDIYQNNIGFTIDNFKATYHELFHLSTTDLKNRRCGLTILGQYGYGIDEGYTQFLSERYFSETQKDAYIFEVILIKILEKIIGQDNMENYYFGRSLELLINDLVKYESKDNVMDFIKNFDLLLKNDISYIENPTDKQKEYFQQLINKICNFLFTCLENKVNFILNNNIVNKEILNDLSNTKFTITATYIETSTKNKHSIKMFDETKVLKLKNLIKEFKIKSK